MFPVFLTNTNFSELWCDLWRAFGLVWAISGDLGLLFGIFWRSFFQLDFQVPFWRGVGDERPAAVVHRPGGGNPSEIPGKGIRVS